MKYHLDRGVCKSSTSNPPVFSRVLSPSCIAQGLGRKLALSAIPSPRRFSINVNLSLSFQSWFDCQLDLQLVFTAYYD